jgi:hypothetical protein
VGHLDLNGTEDSFYVIAGAQNQAGIQPIEITCFFKGLLPLPGIGC